MPSGTSIANSDGKITISNFATSDKYQYSVGNTFDANNAIPATATAVPMGGVIVNNLGNANQSYTVRITNSNDCYVDRIVNLTLTSCSCTTPILADLTNENICVDGSFSAANVTTSVTNGVSVSYQWYNDDGTDNPNTNAINGQMTATLTALPTAVGNYKYRVEAIRTDDTSCKASKTVTLTIYGNLSAGMTSTDADNTIVQGESVTFTGTGGNRYEFFVNNQVVQANSSTNTYTTTTLADGDKVKVRVSNTVTTCSEFSQEITMTVNCVAPALMDLTDESICVGGSFTSTNVTTSVTNGVSVSYQWYNDNGTDNPNTNAINGQTTATLTALPTAVGTYKYRVAATRTDDATCTASKTVNLIIYPNLTAGLSSNATNNTITLGESVTFTGTGGNRYEFFVNNQVVQANSTTNTYTTTTLVNGDKVKVRVSNVTTTCSEETDEIAMTVNCAARFYVDKNATAGTNTGASWENAFTELQTAIKFACNGAEIWVAKGTYYPDEGSGITNNNRNSKFSLRGNQTIIGGFMGSEPADYDITLRDFDNNKTILSGDIDQNDIDVNNFTNANFPRHNNGANTKRVVTIANRGAQPVVLDGFTIEGGMADLGAGIFITNSSKVTIRNCHISRNEGDCGSGVAVRVSSHADFIDCTFSYNASTNGFAEGG